MARKGSCHCGRIAYEVEGDLSQVIECNCSHCLRKGLLLAFVPRAQLTLTQPDTTSTYFFNKHVIQHRFCPNCGTQPFGYGKDRGGKEIAAINVRCLEDIDLATLRIQKFDGRSL
jgi:hypothetical protein